MSVAKKILVVDDEPNNIMVLRVLLKQMGHDVVGAENAVIALKILDGSFDLVLSDVVMPQINGFEMVEKIRGNPVTHAIPIIMVTTLSEKGDRLRAVEAGANDFVTKPVDAVELRVRVNSMLKLKAQQDEIEAFTHELNLMVESRTTELRLALSKLDNANRESIQHLSAAAEHRDIDTSFHIRRMSHYSATIASGLSLDKEMVDLILTSSPMHDVGKIGIPDSILLKPGKLDADEWQVMKTHTTIGQEILGMGNSYYMNMGTVIALSHHEKWDGSGYPSGLSGEDIPLPGRICAVADVFDALTSKRPYKEAFSVGEALAIMKEGRANHFDPKLLDIFLEHFDEISEIYENFREKMVG